MLSMNQTETKRDNGYDDDPIGPCNHFFLKIELKPFRPKARRTSMTTPTLTTTRERISVLDLFLLGVGNDGLGAKLAARLDLLVFYQSLHCQVCTKYLSALERLEPEFEKGGVRSVAISFDGSKSAAKDGREGQRESCVLSLRLAAPSRSRVRASPERRSRQGVRALKRAPRLSGQSRRNALLRNEANHAVRAPAVRLSSWHHRLPDYKGLPLAQRIHGRSLRLGRTQSLRCWVVPSVFDLDLPEPGGHAQDLMIPTDSCILFHQRAGCNALLIRKVGYCRLFFAATGPLSARKNKLRAAGVAPCCRAMTPVPAPRVRSLNQGEIL